MKSLSFSSAHNVLLNGSKNTSLLNNHVNYGVFGIRLINYNNNTFIDNNTVYEGIGDAILLEGNFSNLNITHNDLDGSFMGINFNGYSVNVNVEHNLIHNMHYHDESPNDMVGAEYDAFYGFVHGTDLYGSYYNAIQVWELASNFHGEVHIENNVFIKTQHRSWEARKTHTYVNAGCDGYGYNLWDGSSSYLGINNGAMGYNEGKVDLVIDRIGDSTYRLRLINRLSNKFLSEIPTFDVIFKAGSYTQTVQFVDNQAVATFDVAVAITDVTAIISSYISKSASWDMPITAGYTSSNKASDSGYHAGEAINNPNPHIPSIEEYINSHQNHNNGNVNTGSGGSGNGQGPGNGHGSQGSGNSNVKGREGEVEGNANNLVKSDSGTSQSIGVVAAASGNDADVEGGLSEDNKNTHTYEVEKKINIENNWQYVLAIVLILIGIFLGYLYHRRKNDGSGL